MPKHAIALCVTSAAQRAAWRSIVTGIRIRALLTAMTTAKRADNTRLQKQLFALPTNNIYPKSYIQAAIALVTHKSDRGVLFNLYLEGNEALILCDRTIEFLI
jgi:hypothetical protein